MRDATLQILAVTQHGVALAQRCRETLEDGVRIFAPADDTPAVSMNGTIERYEAPASQQVGVLLREGTPLLVIAPVGEVVLLLAPHLHSEASHAPVVAVDTEGRFVVPLLARGSR